MIHPSNVLHIHVYTSIYSIQTPSIPKEKEKLEKPSLHESKYLLLTYYHSHSTLRSLGSPLIPQLRTVQERVLDPEGSAQAAVVKRKEENIIPGGDWILMTQDCPW